MGVRSKEQHPARPQRDAFHFNRNFSSQNMHSAVRLYTSTTPTGARSEQPVEILEELQNPTPQSSQRERQLVLN